MVKVLCVMCRGIDKKMKRCDHCNHTGWVDVKNNYEDIDYIDDKVNTS